MTCRRLPFRLAFDLPTLAGRDVSLRRRLWTAWATWIPRLYPES